jgi:hypothetical protein
MTLESALVGIGHRLPLEKTYYLVRSGDGSRQTVLSMVTVSDPRFVFALQLAVCIRPVDLKADARWITQAPKGPACPLVLSSKHARAHFRNFVKQIGASPVGLPPCGW